MPAAEFKAHCLGLLDQVAEGREITIDQAGKAGRSPGPRDAPTVVLRLLEGTGAGARGHCPREVVPGVRRLAVKYLADTHVVVWWLTADKALPQSYKRLLDAAEARGPRIGVSAISLWEIAKLHERGRLLLENSLDQCLQDIEAGAAFEVLHLTGAIAGESSRLGPAFPRDPADQLIAATARCSVSSC